MSNKVVEYLKRAFDGRNLEADAEKLGITIEKLQALIEEGGLITAKFATELEAKVNSIRAKELLAVQLEQAKAEASEVANVDEGVKLAREQSPAAETKAPKREGRGTQTSAFAIGTKMRAGNMMV